MVSEGKENKITWRLICSCLILVLILIFNNLFGNEVFTIITSILVLALDYDTIKFLIKKENLKKIENKGLQNEVVDQIKYYKLYFQTIILSSQLAQVIFEIIWGKDFIYYKNDKIILLNVVHKGGVEAIFTIIIGFIVIFVFAKISNEIFKEVIESDSVSQTTQPPH